MYNIYNIKLHLSEKMEAYLINYACKNGMSTFSAPDKVANSIVQILTNYIEQETACKVDSKTIRRK